MKKTILFLIAITAFGLMGCDRNSQPVKENPSDAAASLEGCDMAVFEDGKVTFYNSSTNTFVPFTDEKDYVLSGVFFDENEFCYTVSVDDELYLKKIDLSADKPAPVELADWELKLSDCYDENSEKCASMVYYPEVQMVGIAYNLGELCMDFLDEKYYLIEEQTKCDGWPEGVDEGFIAYQYFIDHVHFVALPIEEGGEEMRFYYSPDDIGMYGSEEEMAENLVCISDKINFHEDKYSGWDGEPEFEILGISPDGDCAAYAAIMEWGCGGHGPLCFATLDGDVQKLLAYDAFYGWLSNNKLVFSDDEGIKTIDLDGTITELSPGHRFATVY